LIKRLRRATKQATKGAKARALVLRVRRAAPRTHREDQQFVALLSAAHARLNAERFRGALKPVSIRVSRRMVRRLGHYAPGAPMLGRSPEIAVSARHLRRDGEARVLETLLHEMVHQWQHEQGLPIDHGSDFRKICVAVGATPRAALRGA
jgi:hypothetical protein